MSMKWVLPALLFAALVVACDSATAPDPQLSMNAAAAADGLVPIRIQETAFTAPDAMAVVCEPAAAGVALPDRLLARGVASHLGQVSSVITGASCVVDLTSGVVAIAGTAERTAANGDLLLATWAGTLAGGTLTLDITFTGGTGRFRNATGWAHGSGYMDASTGTGAWTAAGRISAPGR
jgi:hypothetical protein